MATVVQRDDVYILNYCTKSLARDNTDARHNYGQYSPGDTRATIAEAWRFPVIDSYYDRRSYEDSYAFNTVTFVFVNTNDAARDVAVIGTFSDLVTPIPMPRVGDSVYRAVSVAVPKGQVHRYRFVVDGKTTIDPVNPQRVTTPEGTQWSRFFTQVLHRHHQLRALGTDAPAAADRPHPPVPHDRGSAVSEHLLR